MVRMDGALHLELVDQHAGEGWRGVEDGAAGDEDVDICWLHSSLHEELREGSRHDHFRLVPCSSDVVLGLDRVLGMDAGGEVGSVR